MTASKKTAALAELTREIRKLIEQSASSAGSSTSTPASTPQAELPCPYKGLEIFTEEDKDFFFGREEIADKLVERVNNLPLVALVGPSGSGKSSIVQAGLLPRLRKQKDAVWGVAIFRPGTAPYETLALRLIRVEDPKFSEASEQRGIELGNELAKEQDTISNAFKSTLENAKGISRLLIVADQFEELLNDTPENIRQSFIKSLIAAVKDFPQVVTLLLTLRADFIGQAISLSTELSDLMEQGTVYLRRMKKEEMEAAIVAPAQKVGIKIDPRLTGRILTELERQPDSLPLLEFALQQLWKKRVGTEIGLQQYEEIGGVEKAISNKADEVLEKLSKKLGSEKRQVALRTLAKLVRVASSDEDGGDTRRRVSLASLTAEERTLLKPFIDARLLVTNSTEQRAVNGTNKQGNTVREETVEVTHEALIRKWDALKHALDNDREFLIWKRSLRFRMDEWEKNKREDSLLLPGRLLAEAKQRLAERPEDLKEEREYITWDERDEHQIDLILTGSAVPLSTASTEAVNEWITTLCHFDHQRAIETAKSINDSYYRVEALTTLVEPLAKILQPNESKQVLNDALAIYETVEPMERVKVLNVLLKPLAKADRLNDVLAAAEKIIDPQDQAKALKALVQPLAKAQRLGEALTTAERILDLHLRAEALTELIEPLAKACRHDDSKRVMYEALADCKEISSPDTQARVLAALAESLAKADRLDDALAICEKLTYPYYQAEVLRALVEPLAKAHRLDDALAAYEMVDPRYQRWVLTALVEPLTKVDRLDDALAAYEKIADPHEQVEALKALVEPLAKAQGLAYALATYEKLTEPQYQAEALKALIGPLVQADRLDDALAAAEKITNPFFKADALEVLVKSLANADRLSDALAIYEKNSIPDYQWLMLKALVQSLAEANRLDDALTAYEKITDPFHKTSVLEALVKPLAKTHRLSYLLVAAARIPPTDGRTQLLLLVLQYCQETQLDIDVANTIALIKEGAWLDRHEETKSVRFFELASLLSKMHLFKEARDAADKCVFRPSIHLAAYTAILREYLIKQRPQLREVFKPEAEAQQ